MTLGFLTRMIKSQMLLEEHTTEVTLEGDTAVASEGMYVKLMTLMYVLSDITGSCYVVATLAWSLCIVCFMNEHTYMGADCFLQPV